VIVQPVRFPYTQVGATVASLMPRLAITLSRGPRTVDIIGLLDTGAAVNVLPYSVGATLGANWDQQRATLPLTGSLGNIEARALVVWASHPQLTPHGAVRLVFAWVRTDAAPVVFGQTNFFMEFDVCFFRAQGAFEVHLKGT
jgi:hypothetical protein